MVRVVTCCRQSSEIEDKRHEKRQSETEDGVKKSAIKGHGF